ncbi:STAS domain-containing protein [Pontibacillus litoralis]|uniref:Anti-sigma factor antagonist n=1 Tax=Pontibacillus litoralis JSM 072002 TaxID=1385512 RepID=A0A0A5G651_9BACI|nr:STAS domain-containing protein [Pontibacillus litoralis]KGX86560.1 positive regulator of sigma-B activity [Pontibacillus litoralis JSM 072002]
MDLTIEVAHDEHEQVRKVVLIGEIDAYTAPKLKETIVPLTEENGVEVVIDMHAISYMDSTGLGVFISALKSTKEHGSSLTFMNPQERVYRLFKITGLTEIMNIQTDYTVRGGM